MKALKKFANKLYLLPIGLVIMLSSCGSYTHYPTYQNVSQNTNAKELEITPFFTDGNEGVSASYSVTKSLGVFTTLNTFSHRKAIIIDIGSYYYKPISLTKDGNTKIILSNSFSYGYGKTNHYAGFDLKMDRLAIQPSVAFTSDFMDFGISNRFSYLKHKATIYNSSYATDLLRDEGKKPFYFSELNMYFGGGWKWVKLYYHFNSTAKMNNANMRYYKADVGYLSLSIKGRLDKIFKKKNHQ